MTKIRGSSAAHSPICSCKRVSGAYNLYGLGFRFLGFRDVWGVELILVLHVLEAQLTASFESLDGCGGDYKTLGTLTGLNVVYYPKAPYIYIVYYIGSPFYDLSIYWD